MATRMDIDERQGTREDSRTSETPVSGVEGIPEAIGPSSSVKVSLGPEQRVIMLFCNASITSIYQEFPYHIHATG